MIWREYTWLIKSAAPVHLRHVGRQHRIRRRVSAEAVCVHTSKVYDSCRSKECLRDIRVYLMRDAQDMLDSGGIVSVKPRAADLLCVKIDVEPVQFNRGLYSVDSRFFYRIECEVSCAVGRPRIVDGLAVFDKRVMLFGGEGGARIFSSHYIEDGTDVQLRPDSATVQPQ